MVWVLTVHAYTVKVTANDRQCLYQATPWPQTWQFKSCVAIPLRIASNINMNYDCVASCVWVLKVHAYTVKATANDRQCMYRPLASNKGAI